MAALAPAGSHPALVWGVLIGAEMPDFDFVIRYWGGDVAYLRHHRGPTHGLAVLPAEAALIAWSLRWVWPAVPFGSLFLWSLLGCLSHVLFDMGNDYGTQALWPFSGRRIARDIIPIVDWRIFAIIGAGWLAAGQRPGSRMAVFTGVWVAMGAYVLFRLWQHRRARAAVAAHFGPPVPCGEAAACGPGWREEQLSVHPTILSLTAFRYVLQRPGEVLVGLVNAQTGRVGQPQRSRNQMDAVVRASLQSEVVAAFAEWVRRPGVRVDREGEFFRVRWSDMRYEVDEYSPYTAFAVLDRDLKLVDDGLGSKAPPRLDRELIRRRVLVEMGRDET